MKNIQLILILFFGIVLQIKAQSKSLDSIVFEAKYQYSINYPRYSTMLIFVNGSEMPSKYNIFDKINPNDMDSFHVPKPHEARKKYGDRAFVGVVEVTLKKDSVDKYEKLLKEVEVKPTKDNFTRKPINKKLYKTTIKGVIRGVENQILPKAIITNLTKKEVYYSNTSGKYRIKVAVNDSIGFYSKGFEFYKVKVKGGRYMKINLKINNKPIRIGTDDLLNALLTLKKK